MSLIPSQLMLLNRLCYSHVQTFAVEVKQLLNEQ